MKWYALDGRVFDAVKIGDDEDGCVNDDGTCCGCRKPSGTEHDPGCDWEPCPRCSGQAIACDCECEERPMFTTDGAREIIAKLSAALADYPCSGH